jgi:hypothetical protein
MPSNLYVGDHICHLGQDVRLYEPQSGTDRFSVSINTTESNMSAQNVTFNDAAPAHSYVVDSMPDSTFAVADSDDADLGNFFSRPVKIATLVWPTGTTLYSAFDPWSLYFENPRVINRISNFNLLRAKLHVRFLVNGNAFYHGRALVSYTPLKPLDTISLDRAFIPQDIITASQKPHLYLDPCTSQGGDMVLPFFWYKNCLSVPSGEWDQMGELIVHAINTLKHTNGNIDPINISVFAWAEDVSLSVPTSVDAAGISAQSGCQHYDTQSGNDEYAEGHTGPISKPASVIANMAGKMSSIPGIAPYARATGMAASTVAGVASLLGYSRPADIEGIHSYKPVFGGNMANTNVPDTSLRLTLDAKQELTLDPRTVGLGDKDEMSISGIVCRESYLTTFPWALSKTSEQLLWSCDVSPNLFDIVAAGNPEYHMTPMCYGSMPFRNWRGSIKYRFQIVSSGFHKGRLKFVFDPNQHLSNEYNTNYVHVIDIAETKDFTMEVGWGQPTSFLLTKSPISTDVPFATTQVIPNLAFANGSLSVYVVNKLTSPVALADDNDIAINVMVSAGDDFQLANPTDDQLQEFSIFIPQSGIEMAEILVEGSEPLAPVVEQTLAKTLSNDEKAMAVYYGEVITSYRTLLKRYCYHTCYGSEIDNKQSRVLKVVSSVFPHYRGYDPAGVDLVGTDPYNRSRTTLINWLTPCFGAYRGGVRWKVMPLSNPLGLASLRVARFTDPPGAESYSCDDRPLINSGSTNLIRQSFNFDLQAGVDGMAVTAGENSGVVEAELPFMSIYRFFPARRTNKTTQVPFQQWMQTTAHYSGDSGNQRNLVLGTYCAAAEDFSLFFFLATPILWRIGRNDPNT